MTENKTKTVRGRFVKGQSGNPGGRPKANPEVREIMNAASPKAAQTLVGLLDSKKEMMRFYAAQEILNRTEGKPVQAQEINVNGHLDVRGQVRALLQERLKNERQREGNERTGTSEAGNE